MPRNSIFFLIVILIVTSMVFITLGLSQKATADKTVLIKKGEYLVTITGCNDCHFPKVFTPEGPVPDTKKLLSGHPANAKLPPVDKNLIGPGKWVLLSEDLTVAVGPWGMSFSANLTPDDQSGIGLWTEDVFIKALRNGKHMGAGRPILPPMPWFNLVNANDEDLKAIFAYLKSLPPVKNQVSSPIPPDELGK